MGAGACFGFGRLYWGASAIVVLSLTLELAVLAAISAVNEGRLTRGPGMLMKLFGWAPFIWLGANLAYLVGFQLIGATVDDIKRRLGAMALAPAGVGVIACVWQSEAGWQEGLLFLGVGTVFGYGVLGLPILAAMLWMLVQVPRADVANDKASE